MAFAAIFAFVAGLLLGLAISNASKITIDEWIAAAGSIGTLVTAVATFLTVQEMARQRRNALRPELIIERTHVHGNISPTSTHPLTWWLGSTSGATDPKFEGIQLKNLGAGFAREIVIHWECDFGTQVRVLTEIVEKAGKDPILSFENGFLQYKAGDRRMALIWRNEERDRIDTIIPFRETTESSYLQIPLAYMALSVGTLRSLLDSSAPAFDFEPLIAGIEYTDIDGNEYSKRFKIQFEPTWFSDTEFSGMFTAETLET